jgi:hypothetical protein
VRTPGEEPPERAGVLTHKSQAKVMFLAASKGSFQPGMIMPMESARSFDGKIGCWPFVAVVQRNALPVNGICSQEGLLMLGSQYAVWMTRTLVVGGKLKLEFLMFMRTYVELPYPDAKVAEKLCFGRACYNLFLEELSNNVEMEETGASMATTKTFILSQIVPNIRKWLPDTAALVLGKALLWLVFLAYNDSHHFVPQSFKDPI